ncbi:hypothetical protein TNCV_2477721 [Trichonephila clavipes]|nr:hypothetical protein TNCV_2477721 [Trichonephila clavipes]
MGHEDELTIELQEILNEEHQETQRNVSPSEQEEDERGPMPAPAITDFLKIGWMAATAGSDVVQSGRPIFDDFFQHLWPYIGNNTANVVFQMVKRLWLIRIDQ